MAGNGGTEARVSHSSGMAIRNGLQQNRVVGNLVPVDLREELAEWRCKKADTHIFEVLLLQNGKEKSSHAIFCVGSHDDEACGRKYEGRTTTGESRLIWSDSCSAKDGGVDSESSEASS